MRGKAQPAVFLRPAYWLVAVALWTVAGAAAAQAPKQLIVTRESQDLYRVAEGSFYIKTRNCHEHIYGDRVGLRLISGAKGGSMTFRNGRTCVIERFLRDFEPSPLDLTPYVQ